MQTYVGSGRSSNALMAPLVAILVLLVAALGFGGWAFAQMLDYKNNSDQKVAQAVATAKQQEDAAKDASFAEAEKRPLRAYKGSEAYGSLVVNYPKTWSAYVIDTRSSSPFIDGYFAPGAVPDAQSQNSVFSLRVQIVQAPYNTELNSFSSLVQQGKTKVSAYSAPKVPNVVGARVDGQLANNKTGSMVILPMRNMTLKIWTESPLYLNDFNTYVLPNFSFLP